MKADKPMTLISLRLPEHVIDDLKEIAPTLGFGGYQALIRAYISTGLRQHLMQTEAEEARNNAVAEFSRRLRDHGVPESAISEVTAEMHGTS